MERATRTQLISTNNLLHQKKDMYLFDIRDFMEHETELIQYLSNAELERGHTIKSISGKKRFLVRKSIVRIVLSQYLNIEPREIIFQYGRYQKPSVIHASKNLNFNLSHSKQYLLMGVNTERAIGVDIETKESISKRDIHLFTNYLSNNELALFNQASEFEKRTMFHRIWVQKEAISKALGLGLIMDFSKIDLSVGVKNKQNCAKYLFLDKEIKVKIIQYVDYVIAIATL